MKFKFGKKEKNLLKNLGDEMKYKKYYKIKKLLSWISIMLLILVSMNIIIFSAPVVMAEGGSPDIHLDELGFSKEFVSTLSTTWYCPRFEQNSNWETQIILSNPSENNAQLYIYYYDSSGQYIDTVSEVLDKKNTIDFISLDHDIEDETGSIKISSSEQIFGDVIYYSEYCGVAEPLQYSPSTVLFCPGFYQTTDWDTWICVNNIESSSSEITYTYYDDEGTLLDTFDELLSPNEIRYFKPSDDEITDTLGSVIIESNVEDALIGYILKMNNDGTKAYSYSLCTDMNNNHCTHFITDDDNTEELIFFNPETNVKTLNLYFYDEEGEQIYSFNQQLLSHETFKMLINDYVGENNFGLVNVESNYNGVVGYFGHIGDNYALANSIEITDEEQFYSSFNSYKEIDFPSIFFTNPMDDESLEIDITMHDNDEEDDDDPNDPYSSEMELGSLLPLELAEPNCYFLTYNQQSSYWSDCMVQPSDGGEGNWGWPDWWSSCDTDGDKLDDHIEDWLFPATIPPGDMDGDGKSDGKYDDDTDGDGMKDGWEYRKLGRGAVGDSTGNNGANGDPDNDGLTNLFEYQTTKTHPKNDDTDGDYMKDKYEYDCGQGQGWQDPKKHNNRFALLLIGGGNPASNHARYWNDLVFMYDTLIDDYYYQANNIIVLYANGNNPSDFDGDVGSPPTHEIEEWDDDVNDTGNCHDAHHIYDDKYYEEEDDGTGEYGKSEPFDDDEHDNIINYGASKSNLSSVFNFLDLAMDENDFLYLWVNDHGNGAGGGGATHSNIVLWGENIRDDTFAGSNYLGKISNYKRMVLIFKQCFSGGFIDDCSSDDRVIMSAVLKTAFSHGSTKANLGYYGVFCFFHTSALHGDWPNIVGDNAPTGSVDADSDSDGYTSMVESFEFVWENNDGLSAGLKDLYPQYDDSGDGKAHPAAGYRQQSTADLDNPATQEADGDLTTYM